MYTCFTEVVLNVISKENPISFFFAVAKGLNGKNWQHLLGKPLSSDTAYPKRWIAAKSNSLNVSWQLPFETLIQLMFCVKLCKNCPYFNGNSKETRTKLTIIWGQDGDNTLLFVVREKNDFVHFKWKNMFDKLVEIKFKRRVEKNVCETGHKLQFWCNWKMTLHRLEIRLKLFSVLSSEPKISEQNVLLKWVH